jgi:hypothetical protein
MRGGTFFHIDQGPESFMPHPSYVPGPPLSYEQPAPGKSRAYHACRRKLTPQQFMIHFIPTAGRYSYYLQSEDISLITLDKAGGELIIEMLPMTVTVTGRNLAPIAEAIDDDLCGSIEAFNPHLWDMPEDPLAPFVSSIEFRDSSGRESRYGDGGPSPFKPTLVK